MPKLRAPWDLLAILALTSLLVICIALIPSGTPRILLGLPFVLFVPGYTLLAAMFPRNGGMETTQRVALSFVLSMAIVPLFGLLLNFVWEVSVYPILISIAAFVATLCGVALIRRARLAPQEQFQPRLGLQIPRLPPLTGADRILATVLAVMMFGAVATLIYVGTRPRDTESFTEFYLLGSSQTAQYYPQEVVLGVQARVTVGIVNREGEEVTYRVRVVLNGSEVQVMDALALGDGAMWEDTVTLTPTTAGDNQQVEFLLYRADDSEPYRKLHLWIDVRDPSIPPSTP